MCLGSLMTPSIVRNIRKPCASVIEQLFLEFGIMLSGVWLSNSAGWSQRLCLTRAEHVAASASAMPF